jgi:hypothetical protein
LRRAFWVAVGLGAGVATAVLVSRWMSRQAAAMAPSNIARQAGETARDVASLLAEAAAEFRRGMAEREAEVRSLLPG